MRFDRQRKTAATLSNERSSFSASNPFLSRSPEELDYRRLLCWENRHFLHPHGRCFRSSSNLYQADKAVFDSYLKLRSR